MPGAVVYVTPEELRARIAIKRGELDVIFLEFTRDVAKRVGEVARAIAPKRTGNLAMHGIDVGTPVPTLSGYVAEVGLSDTVPYAEAVHGGSGLYGPKHSPMYAGAGNVFAFRGSGSGMVFAKMVKGQRPQPFLRDAYVIVNETYVPARVRALGDDITDI